LGKERCHDAVKVSCGGTQTNQSPHIWTAISNRCYAPYKKGQPAHKVTGVARANSIQF
jgi:hypothetical protein